MEPFWSLHRNPNIGEQPQLKTAARVRQACPAGFHALRIMPDLPLPLRLPPVPAADLFKERASVTLADLYSTYMQTYTEQKQRQQQQQMGGQPQQQPDAVQYRSISQAQMQMAVLQLTDMVNMRGGVLTRKGAAAAAAGPAAQGAAGVAVGA